MYEHLKPLFTPVESLFLTLEYYDGLSVEEIAAAMGVTLNEALRIQNESHAKARELKQKEGAKHDEGKREDARTDV